jgi:hypothetical protein
MTDRGRVVSVVLGALVALAGTTIPARVFAFCGFYVGGAESSIYANATMTVLMRDGTRTVLSMQNNYQGPPEAFALVIPVPTVLQKDQVKVLPKDVFARVDALGAPRLVEYWEIDPCRPAVSKDDCAGCSAAQATSSPNSPGSLDFGSVRVEAQFEVGEYDIVILSADDSSALDGWLRANQYNIPKGADPVLAPYVASGMKFFVAKVDPARVTFEKGQAALSPLRFHYDTPEFSLPVRLGLLNSDGSQDLIVNILARQRYELANYENVTIPTNIRVNDEVRKTFPSFYEALFARTLAKNPKAVVTEYAWSAATCDPCPTEPLNPKDLATLGADVLVTQSDEPSTAPGTFPPSRGSGINFTLTRLHARYTKDSLGEDLVFTQADPIAGGRGIPDRKGSLEQGLEKLNSGGSNCPFGCGFDNFQGRYVILHPWEGPLRCLAPQRGFWGGPDGTDSAPMMTKSAPNTAIKGVKPTAGDLPALLAESVPAIDVRAKEPRDPLSREKSSGCSVREGEAATGAAASGFLLMLAGSLLVARRRRNRSGRRP